MIVDIEGLESYAYDYIRDNTYIKTSSISYYYLRDNYDNFTSLHRSERNKLRSGLNRRLGSIIGKLKKDNIIRMHNSKTYVKV